MTRFTPLKTLLMDNLVEPIAQKDTRFFVRLKETGPAAKLKRVDIFDIPEGSILIKLDQVRQPDTLFKGSLGERRRCDYVLVTDFDNHPVMVFIELKSRAVKDSEVTRQFKGAECLLDYCNSALDRFHGQNNLLGQCRKCFVVFYKPSVAKQRTRPVFSGNKRNSSESPLKYPSPRNPSLKALVNL
jgi:hypothetical protein